MNTTERQIADRADELLHTTDDSWNDICDTVAIEFNVQPDFVEHCYEAEYED